MLEKGVYAYLQASKKIFTNSPDPTNQTDTSSRLGLKMSENDPNNPL